MRPKRSIDELLEIMSRLRGPGGCPWDRQQNHKTLCHHAIEEVYELLDAIEAGDDSEIAEELGDLLLQVIFHCQMAKERGAFDFEVVCRRLADKLIHRHPHVFGNKTVHTAKAVLAQWDHLKHAEKKGTTRERASALDGIPKHLPALMRAEKLVKKARKANLLCKPPTSLHLTRERLAKQLFALAEFAQRKGWSAEQLLAAECRRMEKFFRRRELKGMNRFKG